MLSVNLMSLIPFDKNKNIWMYFYKENILANLMANQVDAAVFSDEIPALYSFLGKSRKQSCFNRQLYRTKNRYVGTIARVLRGVCGEFT